MAKKVAPKSKNSVHPARTSRSHKRMWVFVGVVVVLVVVLALTSDDPASQLATNNDASQEDDVTPEIVQNEVDIGEDETVLGESVVESEILAEPAEKNDDGEIADQDAAKKRDEQRIKDMEKIRDAMKNYFEDKDAYPGKLSALVPDYLDAVPENPTPGGATYTFTPIGAEITPGTDLYKYYDLAYVLEVGAKDLEPGLHVANPDGLALP